MPVLNNVTVPDQYDPNGKVATIQDVSPIPNGGGWFSLAANGNSAFCEVQYGTGLYGSGGWGDETILGSGAFGTIPSNATGIRFRNAVAGKAAVVTAVLVPKDVPALGVSQLGTVNVVTGATLNFQHNDVFVAAEPTADFDDVANQIGWTITDDPANTRVKVVPTVSASFVFPGSAGTGGASVGPGGVAGNFLAAAGGVNTVVGTTTTPAFRASVVGDTFPRIEIDGNGTINLSGTGSAAADITIGYNSPGVLYVVHQPFGNPSNLSGLFIDWVWSGAINSASATNQAFQASINTDTNPRWQVNCDGKTSWGAGGVAAFDTNLYRSGAGVLQTDTFFVAGTGIQANDGGIWSQRSGAGLVAFATWVAGDPNDRWHVKASGEMDWGPGSATQDISLQRSVLNTVTSLALTSGAGFSNGAIPNSLSASGVVLWSAVLGVVGTVSTNNVFASGVVADTTYRFLINAAGQLNWGPGSGAVDTNLARSAAVPPSAGQVGVASNQAFYSTNTTGGFVYAAPANNAAFLSFAAATDANPQFKIFTQGAFEWGPGGASALDLELARVTNSPTGTGTFLELLAGQGLGYGTGTGGTVTTTNALPSTGTLNKPTGKITSGVSVPSLSNQDYVITNSVVGVDDVIIINLINAGTTTTAFHVTVTQISAGSFAFNFENAGGIAITPVFTFAVIKGAVA